jgi:hypothetical protein
MRIEQLCDFKIVESEAEISGRAPGRSGLFFGARAAGEENLHVMATYVK